MFACFYVSVCGLGLVVLDIEIVAIVIQPAHPTHERFLFYFSLYDVLKQLVPKLIYLLLLNLQFDHNRLFGRRQLVILIISNLFTE